MRTIVERNGRKELIPPWEALTERGGLRHVRRQRSTVVNPRVAWLSAAYLPFGGTETFHRTLLPRLRDLVNISGFVAAGQFGGDGRKLQVPYATGIEAAQQLAASADIVVTWGIDNLFQILPENRPKVIAVHHADLSSDWSNQTILKQLDLIDETVCVNSDVANQLAAAGKPAHYIPNAIDPKRIIPTGRQHELCEEFNIQPGSKIVLFGHRISPEKRPLLAVAVAKYLPRNWVMIIAGDGPERRTVEAMAAGCEKIRVVGEFETLADWLALSDCFLSLATFEGFGLAVGESLLAGVPTVSTPTGIAPGRATTLPAESTGEEWANAIVNATAVVNREQIAEQFSVERMVAAWADVITTH